VDIAKAAVRMAAKRCKDARFLVADLKRKIPFADSSVHFLLNIFAPRNRSEFARVLAQDGLLLVVIPHPEHLLTLRRRFNLLEIEGEKYQQIANQLNEFQLVATQRVITQMELNNEALVDLVYMTPNAWHLSPHQWQEIEATMQFQTQASFEILLFKPTG
jgi:23S rRNA (guanine745-N1)-methyltransferase